MLTAEEGIPIILVSAMSSLFYVHVFERIQNDLLFLQVLAQAISVLTIFTLHIFTQPSLQRSLSGKVRAERKSTM